MPADRLAAICSCISFSFRNTGHILFSSTNSFRKIVRLLVEDLFHTCFSIFQSATFGLLRRDGILRRIDQVSGSIASFLLIFHCECRQEMVSLISPFCGLFIGFENRREMIVWSSLALLIVIEKFDLPPPAPKCSESPTGAATTPEQQRPR